MFTLIVAEKALDKNATSFHEKKTTKKNPTQQTRNIIEISHPVFLGQLGKPAINIILNE